MSGSRPEPGSAERHFPVGQVRGVKPNGLQTPSWSAPMIESIWALLPLVMADWSGPAS